MFKYFATPGSKDTIPTDKDLLAYIGAMLLCAVVYILALVGVNKAFEYKFPIMKI